MQGGDCKAKGRVSVSRIDNPIEIAPLTQYYGYSQSRFSSSRKCDRLQFEK